VRWFRDDGAPVNDAYLDDASRHYLGMLLDGQKLGDSAKAIFVAYNGWSETLFATVPEALPGTTWHLVADTSPSAEAWGNWASETEARPLTSSRYTLAPRSLGVFVAR
jgi:glycogen operon protein